MKDILSEVVVIVGIWGGTRALADVYEVVRKAALAKASQGLPSLSEMNHQLHHSRPMQAAPPVQLAPASDY